MPEVNGDQNNIIKEIAQDIKSISHSLRTLDIGVATAIHAAADDIKFAINHPSDIFEGMDKLQEKNQREEEIVALKEQVDEAQKQTKIMRKQTWYFIGTLIVVALSFIIDVIFRLKNLWQDRF